MSLNTLQKHPLTAVSSLPHPITVASPLSQQCLLHISLYQCSVNVNCKSVALSATPECQHKLLIKKVRTVIVCLGDLNNKTPALTLS